MPRTMTTSRTYTGRLRLTSEIEKLFEENFDNCQKLYAIGFDRAATVCGSWAPVGQNIHSVIPSKDVKETLERIRGESAHDAYRTIVALTNWFPAEVLTDFNKDFVIPSRDIPEKFREYWLDNWGNFDDTVIDLMCLFNVPDNVAFIDRRKKFASTGLNPVLMQRYFLAEKKLDFKGAFASDSQSQKWRNVFSYHFGTGTKRSSFEKEKIIVGSLEEFLGKVPSDEISPDEIRRYLVEKGLWDLDAFDLRGGGPSYFKRIKEGATRPIKIKDYIKLLNTRSKNIFDMENRKPVPKEFRDFFFGSIEAMGYFEAEGNLDLISSAYIVPWGQISSHRSNAVRRICAQLELVDSNANIRLDASREISLVNSFCESMLIKLKIDKYTVRQHQDNGLEIFINYINSMSLPEALQAVANDLEVRSLRNSNRQFLEFVYENREQIQDVQNLKKAVRYHWQFEKIAKANLPYVADVLKNPMRPQYGTSKPYGKIYPGEWRTKPVWMEEVVFDSSLPHVKVSLVTDSGIKKVAVNIDAARAEREILFKSGGDVALPRNTRHLNETFDRHSPPKVSVDCKNPCLTFFKRRRAYGEEEVWMVGITHKMEYQSGYLRELNSPKVMGVDLGWKTAATFSLIQEDVFRPLKKGPMVWEHDVEIFCSGGNVSPELQCLCMDLSENVPEDMEFSDAVKFCAGIIKRSLRTERVVSSYGELIKRLVSLVSPHFASSVSLDRIYNQGGLSFSRIEMMEKVKSLLNTFISLAEPDDPVYANMLSRVESKMNNLKKERARITARMILNTAVANGVNLIVLPDLDIENNVSKMRYMNSGNSRWCGRKVIQSVEGEAPFHGIQVIKVSPWYSSHKDVDGAWLCRKVRINPFTIPEKTKPGKRYQSVNSLTKKLDSYLRVSCTDLDAVYNKSTEEFLGGNSFRDVLEKAKSDNQSNIFVPMMSGDFVESRLLGLCHSDVMTAHILAMRGFERCKSASKKKDS